MRPVTSGRCGIELSDRCTPQLRQYSPHLSQEVGANGLRARRRTCTLHLVNQASRFLWPKDWRVIVLAICCATVGFMAAAVLFGAPWHLPPAWGDIPTWLAFIAASVAGGIALTQLSQQQHQITEESVRNVQRDKLLSTQLTEAQERMNAYRRQQAEQVILTSLGVRHNPDGSLGWTGVCEIANDSRRPIRAVTCRILINGDLIRPTEFRVGEEFRPIIGPPGPGDGVAYLPADEGTFDLGAGKYLHLLAKHVIRVAFPVPGSDRPETVQYLIRFADDAELRWQLDSDMHLSPAPDAQW